MTCMSSPSLSVLIDATAKPEAGGAEEEHRDVLQELAVSWTESSQAPEASITGADEY